MSLEEAILEIRPGSGGLESELWTADLWRMYARFCQKKGFKIALLDQHQTDAGGLKELVSIISGENAYRLLKNEAGVHRVQRIPKTEKYGRIHTSAASVVVLPKMSEGEIKINPQDLKIDVFRSKGHGGQGVNTTDSAVRITHLPTGLITTSQDERSQLRNKEKALAVLRARLAQLQESERNEKLSEERKKMILSGDRSEKIKTYNFPQNRLTDHRINKTWHNLDRILDGDLEAVFIHK